MTEVVFSTARVRRLARLAVVCANSTHPTLLEHAFRAALAKTKIAPQEIDETIVGQVFQGSDAPDIARFCSLRVGIPKEIPGLRSIGNARADWKPRSGARKVS